MVYESLLAILETHLDDLTNSWVSEVNDSDYLETYQKLSDESLYHKGKILFSNLQDWLLNGASNDDAADYFQKIGHERINEGIPLSEVYYALYLEKKVLWSFVAWKDEVAGILTARDAIEYMAEINNYFDLGNFNIIRGYMSNLYTHISDSDKYTNEELESFLAKGALFQESIKKIQSQMYSEGLNVRMVR